MSNRASKYLKSFTGHFILTGAERDQKKKSLPLTAHFTKATIISGIKQESRLIQEEIFGPVLTV